MNKRLIPYVELAQELKKQGKQDSEILDLLKDNGASLAIAMRTLEKTGLELDEVEKLIGNSIVWKDHYRSFQDLFFDFVELDDDLIED